MVDFYVFVYQLIFQFECNVIVEYFQMYVGDILIVFNLFKSLGIY